MKNQQYTVSSLDKIFWNEKPKLLQSEYSVFQNETFHFQVACFAKKPVDGAKIEISSDINEYITVRAVEPVPARFAKYKGRHDSYVIKNHGNNELFPDLLRPLRGECGELLLPEMWSAFWITVNADKPLPVGVHKITVRIYTEYSYYKGVYDETSEFTLTVLKGELPKSALTITQWMHYDCICEKHGVEPFTDGFYKVLEKYLALAIKSGMNMLYTPLFTPPLDTEVGGERKTVQLVKVYADGENYRFDFSKVKEFFTFASERGIEQFELCHLASQWGAKYCIKIVAEVDGTEKRIFGWEDPSSSERYRNFLRAFMREFAAFIKEIGYEDKIFFHISDEPSVQFAENFKCFKEIITENFPSARIMDAVGSRAFKENGMLTHPVIALDHYDDCPTEWVYYCGGTRTKFVPNRHFAMPSQRNRVLGVLCYRNGATGFLHWGFNFYNSNASRYPIDPYFVTDAHGFFDSGDSFLVYPAKDGAYASLRLEVFGDGVYDYRALELLESLIGKEETLKFLDKQGVKTGFSRYPRSAKWHLKFRKALNEKIAALIK